MAEALYAELHARSAFSFLRAGSLPETLGEQAARLGLAGIAVCDRMGVYGAPRLDGTCGEEGIPAIHGAELVMEDEAVLPVLVENRTGYQNLCRLLTRAHLRAGKGQARVLWAELPEFACGLVALTGDEDGPLARAILGRPRGRGPGPRATDSRTGASEIRGVMRRLIEAFGPEGVYVEVQRHHRRGEERLHARRLEVAAALGLPVLATNGVLHATPEGREVVDVFTSLRHHTTLDEAGNRLCANAERHLKSGQDMATLFADVPQAVANSTRLAARLGFRLKDLGYRFPDYPVEPGQTMEGMLRDWTFRGARERYGGRVPDPVRNLLDKELALILRLGFAGYFLQVADLVRFCRDQGILAQGRGSAANSAVCFCLGITAVDPLRFHVLFERFLSEGRKGWPDIDIDLPSGDRRERVIQEVYRRHGPHGAAMTATVITYRGRSAARELGKVLGFSTDVLDRFSALFASGDFPHTLELQAQMEKAGLPSSHPRAPAFARLYSQIARLPRHLGQHSGGMILCQGGLDRVVPLENATMPGRVVCQWDKDDCEDLGLIKVDLLGLGMMAVLQDAVTLARQSGRPVDLGSLPPDDEATYEAMRRADTIGVFQIESRAQMATLPRLQPRCFYDLVIEVAIIRPGPIQGDLAHPYLRRREGLEPVTYWDEKLRPVLERTLGVPLFQEQMLQIAMVLANFSGDEAEELRKALSFHRSDARMRRSQARLEHAMQRAGVPAAVSAQIAKAVGSFALYGFPESHAISFAHLAYASAYLKVHRPAEFYCALLNNQPMGFYSPATVVQDARRHGIVVHPVCVVRSGWECRIDGSRGIRLGLRHIGGLMQHHVSAMLGERERRAFDSVRDFKARTAFEARELRSLAEVGALNALASHRRAALWEIERPRREGDLFEREGGGIVAADGGGQTIGAPQGEGSSPLKPMGLLERLQADYSGLSLTLGAHPMSFLRGRLPGVLTAEALRQLTTAQRVRVAGQVICRQRPGTAKGVCFLSLEDETGIANVIVPPRLFEKDRLKITREPFLMVEGFAERRHGSVHVRAQAIDWLEVMELDVDRSHDFR